MTDVPLPAGVFDRVWDVSRRDRTEEEDADARERIRARREEDGLPVDEAILDRLVRGEGRTNEIEWLTDAESEDDLRAERSRRAAADVVEAYVAEHARDSYGGRWAGPRGRLCVAFTANVDRHTEALRRRLPEPDVVQVERARHTEAELEALADRLFADDEELAALGLRLGIVGADVAEGVVRVEAQAEDPAAAERLLAERYGDAVRVDAIVTDAEMVEAVAWQLWDEPEPGVVRVHYAAMAVFVPERADVEEGEDAIRVTVFERAPGLVNTLGAANRSATVRLARPVGDRAVVDGATGRRRERAA